MFKNQQPKIHFFFLIALFVLWALMMQPVAFAAGRVEYHQITSKIPADAGLRELSVYLPEEYDTSELAYPVLYLLHGGWLLNQYGRVASNYVFFEGPFAVVQSVDKLIGDGKMNPLILVSPNMNLPNIRDDPLIAKDYMNQEVIPFVESKYRTIPNRKGRAIAGWSNGGIGAVYLGLSLPEMFSLVGTYAGGGMSSIYNTRNRDLVLAHKQEVFPLQFWVYCGRNDDFGFLPLNRQFVQALEEANLPHVYIEDDGNHSNMIAQRVVESIVYFSTFLGGGVVTVQPRGKLATTWGEIKRGR